MPNFSLRSYESATFHIKNGPALKASLCIMCFGVFEMMGKDPLSQHCTWLATALSELRLRLFLDFLQETAVDL